MRRESNKSRAENTPELARPRGDAIVVSTGWQKGHLEPVEACRKATGKRRGGQRGDATKTNLDYGPCLCCGLTYLSLHLASPLGY